MSLTVEEVRKGEYVFHKETIQCHGINRDLQISRMKKMILREGWEIVEYYIDICHDQIEYKMKKSLHIKNPAPKVFAEIPGLEPVSYSNGLEWFINKMR